MASSRTSRSQAQRFVIVGGGAGGVELAAMLGRRSRSSGASITLVDVASTHFWKPRLHEVAAGSLGTSEESYPYLAVARENGFKFVLGAFQGLDSTKHCIQIGAVEDSVGAELLPARNLPYDKLVIAIGSQVNDFGTPGVREYCALLDSADQAAGLQRKLLEAAVRSSVSGDRIRIGIVGAGATGVELAAEIYHAAVSLGRYGDWVDPSKLDITLVDVAPRVLTGGSQQVSDFAQRELDRMGVKTLLGRGVQSVTRDGLHLKGGEVVPCGIKVWTSGVIGEPIAARLDGLSVDEKRRIVCDDRLRCRGVEHVFAIGDCASFTPEGASQPLPTTAQVAHQQAFYLARRIGADTGEVPPFVYKNRGSVVSLGARRGTAEIPTGTSSTSIVLHGWLPRFAYRALEFGHEAALAGWGKAAMRSLANILRQRSGPPIKLHG